MFTSFWFVFLFCVCIQFSLDYNYYYYQQSGDWGEAIAVLYCDPSVSGGWCTDPFNVRGWVRNNLDPAMLPSPSPTPDPTPIPSNPPSSNPTKAPIQMPTKEPTSEPSNMPTESPTTCIDAKTCDILPRNIMDEVTTDPICDDLLLTSAIVKWYSSSVTFWKVYQCLACVIFFLMASTNVS